MFWTTLPGSCSYQASLYWIVAFHKTTSVHNFLHYHSSFVLLLSKFVTVTHHMRYSLISCTKHAAKGWLASFVNIVLDVLSSYRLFLGTIYQSLSASFQITFPHPSPCVVLILSLYIYHKLLMFFFFFLGHSFFLRSLVLLNSLGPTVSLYVKVLLFQFTLQNQFCPPEILIPELIFYFLFFYYVILQYSEVFISIFLYLSYLSSTW